MKKAVVLLSGGLDSAVTLFLAKQRRFKPTCLIFDYGQRHRREINAAKSIAEKARCPWKLIRIKLPWKGSALLDCKISIARKSRGGSGIPSTYVPARNIIFLSFALSLAETIAARAVFIGAHSLDYSGYPDCRPEFFRAYSSMIRSGTKSGAEGQGIRICTPLIKSTKAGIIRKGKRLKVPFHLTWSCYQGGKKPCGECDSCYYRDKGFRGAGFKDPLLK
ncbi:7-cyano-7-deazaguanine synthase QueC [Candidatus Omnitrophota bacterium]